MSKKKTLVILGIQLCMWVIFSAIDAYTEIVDRGFPLYPVIYFPIAGYVAYLIYKLVFDRDYSFRNIMLELLVFLGIGVVLSGIIGALLLYELWPITQATGGWVHFLNGIEYYIFAVFYVLGDVVGIFLFGIFSWIAKVCFKSKQ